VTTAFGDEEGVHAASAGRGAFSRWIGRNPVAALVILIGVAFLLWLILAPWPAGFEDVFGKKRIFINALFNGITLGGLYFLVATGFTLIFGLMRNVNLAHGSLYLFGGYMGYEATQWTGSWLFSYVIAFICCAVVGIAIQFFIFRKMEGQDLRQTLVTLGLSIIFADLMVWVWGGNAIQIDTPDYLAGPVPTPIVVSIRSSGEPVFLQYPLVRLVIFAAAVLIGIGMWLALNSTLVGAIAIGILMWLALNRTKIGLLIRAGVDDRDMLSVLGYRVQLLFVAVFAFGAGLAGMAGIVGGTFQSLSLGDDSQYLLASLVVVIVGGMGSIPGAALGALIIGLSEQIGTVYFQNYSTVLSFLIMVVVLALRPQGLLGRR
jgi:branched-chain amino acid transport system permease protein